MDCPLIISRSGSHYKMGVQTGRQGKPLLLENLKRNLEKLKSADRGVQWLEYVYDYENMMDRYAPQLLEELKGMSYGSGVKYEHILLNSCFHEWRARASLYSPVSGTEGTKIEQEIPASECTAFGITGKGSSNGETILHQNVDAEREASEVYIVMKTRPAGGYEFVSSQRAGLLPYNGVNERGLAFVNTGVELKNVRDEGGPGLPVERKIALALEECSTVDEALDYYLSDRGGFSGWQGVNSLIGDVKGKLVRVGITHKHFRVTDASDDGVVAATNNFHDQEMANLSLSADSNPSTHLRYERATELIEKHKGTIDLETVRKFASDHKYGLEDRSICRHGPNRWTYASIEAIPSKRTFWINYENPCLNHWRLFAVG